MLNGQLVSGTAMRLTNIVAELQHEPSVTKAVLCTADGLAVNGKGENAGHISAVGGFMLSAANLSSNLLDLETCLEVTVEFGNEAFLVCHQFWVANVPLILMVLFNQKLAYKRLLAAKIRAIKQELE